MPADYHIKLQSKDKSVKEFVGSGFKGQYGVSLSINITKLFKLAKDHPELLTDYNGEKQVRLFTNINAPDNNTQNNSSRDNVPQAEDLDNVIPF